MRAIAGRRFTCSDEDHLLNVGTTAYQYNLDGFLLTWTAETNVTEYDYSTHCELLSVFLPYGKEIKYMHDPLCKRIAKNVNGVVTGKRINGCILNRGAGRKILQSVLLRGNSVT